MLATLHSLVKKETLMNAQRSPPPMYQKVRPIPPHFAKTGHLGYPSIKIVKISVEE
jgi:hypothetical protein